MALASCGAAVSYLRELSGVCVQQGGAHSGGNRCGERPPSRALKISTVNIARLVQSLPPVAGEDVCRGRQSQSTTLLLTFSPNQGSSGRWTLGTDHLCISDFFHVRHTIIISRTNKCPCQANLSNKPSVANIAI